MLDRRTFIGAFGREGALADYIVVPDGRVLPIRVVPHVSYPPSEVSHDKRINQSFHDTPRSGAAALVPLRGIASFSV
jgi:hypothetical protein